LIREFFKFSESEKWSDFGRKEKNNKKIQQTDEDVKMEKNLSQFLIGDENQMHFLSTLIFLSRKF
jgi:hypothetical protein